jgi:hypothetical protein
VHTKISYKTTQTKKYKKEKKRKKDTHTHTNNTDEFFWFNACQSMLRYTIHIGLLALPQHIIIGFAKYPESEL